MIFEVKLQGTRPNSAVARFFYRYFSAEDAGTAVRKAEQYIEENRQFWTGTYSQLVVATTNELSEEDVATQLNTQY